MQALYRLKLVCSEVSESLYHKFEMDLNSALLFVSKLYESELCFFLYRLHRGCSYYCRLYIMLKRLLDFVSQ